MSGSKSSFEREHFLISNKLCEGCHEKRAEQFNPAFFEPQQHPLTKFEWITTHDHKQRGFVIADPILSQLTDTRFIFHVTRFK